MPLITAGALADRLAAGSPTRVLDVRWTLAAPDGREDYLAGHIPGAVYVDLETELADHSVPGRGRHPLPAVADLQNAVRRWGINIGDTVVVYDNWNAAGSARAWWLLTAVGVPDVRILDGGLAAWTSAGGALESGSPAVSAGDLTLAAAEPELGAMPTLTPEQVAALGDSGVLLDARPPQRYSGAEETVDPVAGHVPGARNLPSTRVLDADGRFLPPEVLREVFDEIGAQSEIPVGAYCGSGITAAVLAAAGDTIGRPVALFPGSWSEWITDPERPIAR